MTREEYLGLKSELKEKSRRLRSLKYQYRADQSSYDRKTGSGSGVPLHETMRLQRNLYWEVREKHIFMSLLRGRTRQQIECNFEEKSCYGKHGMYSSIESALKRLCESYGLEYDLDEYYNVVKIIRDNSKQDAA